MSAVTFCDESHALFIFIYVRMSTIVACMPTLAGTDQVKCHSSRMKSIYDRAIFNFYSHRNKSITILTEWVCVQLNS